MAVTMKNVRAVLEPEEPDYDKAAKLGPDALPHLEALVNSGDTMLASKATYAASLIKDPKAAEVVETAAQSDDPAVRVAAAAGASNLAESGASTVLVNLIGDPDPGVRKVARASVPEKAPAELMKRLEDLGEEEPESLAEPDGRPAMTGPMPGEGAEDAPGTTGQMMPGEQPGGMPGEQSRMPGEMS